MPTPHVLILRSPGANCDRELAFAFQLAGAAVDRVHVNRLRDNPGLLRRYQILALPGGFSHGDDIAAGKVLAVQLTSFLAEAIRRFRDAEKLVLGICNGFQTTLKAGLLVPPDEEGPLATLAANATGRFQDRWTTLTVSPHRCPFLQGLKQLELPVAHGEGNFRCRADWILRGLDQAGQVVLRYAPGQNPNGSQGDVAGLCDATGRVLGLMPHPERHVLPLQHPRWTRRGPAAEADGLAIFRNAVTYFA